MTRTQAVATPLFENDTMRAVRFDFAPGAETGWHRHGHDYVVTTVTPCRMRVEMPDGEVIDASFDAGEAYSRSEGVEHNVVNAADVPMSFVELEFIGEKGAA